MKYLILFLFLAGCTTEPLRSYNNDDIQDQSCYGKYGGAWGYCDTNKGALK